MTKLFVFLILEVSICIGLWCFFVRASTDCELYTKKLSIGELILRDWFWQEETLA